jgi:hypothetical protein
MRVNVELADLLLREPDPESNHPGLKKAENVTITDRLAGPGKPFVLVSTSLPTIMSASTMDRCRAILLTKDVTAPLVRAISLGVKAYSTFHATDLRIDRSHWQLIACRSHGLTNAEAARVVGYSERHARRILAELTRTARVPSCFRWPLLSPLFPDSRS